MTAFSYAAAQGFIRARLSRLIDPDTWRRLLEANSVAALGHLLGGTSAASAITREGAVRLLILRGETASAGRAVARFLPRSSRRLVAWYNQRFVVENLKTVLRAVHYDLDRQRAAASLVPLRSPRWPWESLLEARTIGQLIDRIRDSPFSRPLENAMERYGQEKRLFYLEVALDLFYFQELVRLIESQSGADSKDARAFLGRWIAVQNLLWAYRYRIYGRMSSEEVINYTLHRAFGGGLDAVRRVVLGSAVREEAARLGFEVSPGASELRALTEIELEADRKRFERARAVLDRPISRLGGVLGYLWLLDAEIRDLSVLVEGKATGLSSGEIARRLVRAA